MRLRFYSGVAIFAATLAITDLQTVGALKLTDDLADEDYQTLVQADSTADVDAYADVDAQAASEAIAV